MNVSNFPASARRAIKENSSLILSVGAGVGVVATGYFAAVGAQRAQRILDQEIQPVDLKERVRLVWRLYIPAGAAGAATIICIASVKRIDGRKTLAAQTALAVTQQAYSQYRDRIIDEFGDKKDQEILGRVAEQKISAQPPPAVVIGDGSFLCCELYTGRYFMSDMQTLERAVNTVNAAMLKHDYATLFDFYYEVGLDPTDVSSQSGWSSDKLLQMTYSSVLHKGRPVLAFEYNYVKTF